MKPKGTPNGREAQQRADDKVLREAVELSSWLLRQGYDLDRATAMTSTAWGRSNVRRIQARTGVA